MGCLFGLIVFRSYLRIQRSYIGVRIVPGIRNTFNQSETNQWFTLCRHEHLQCGCALFNHRSSCNGYCLTAGRIVRVYGVGCYFLLLSQHVTNFCAKGLYFMKNAHQSKYASILQCALFTIIRICKSHVIQMLYTIHTNANELIQLYRQFKVHSMQIKLTLYNDLMNRIFIFYLFHSSL